MKMENEQAALKSFRMLTVLTIRLTRMNKDWERAFHAQIDIYSPGRNMTLQQSPKDEEKIRPSI